MNIVKNGKQKEWVEELHTKLLVETTYKNGKKDGPYKSYDFNGSSDCEGFYGPGEKDHGVFKSWYENGQLEDETTFKHGKQEGPCKSWDKYGHLITDGTYNENEEFTGYIKEWYENGQQKLEYILQLSIWDSIFCHEDKVYTYCFAFTYYYQPCRLGLGIRRTPLYSNSITGPIMENSKIHN